MTTLIQWNKVPSTLHNDRTIYESINLTVSSESNSNRFKHEGNIINNNALETKANIGHCE